MKTDALYTQNPLHHQENFCSNPQVVLFTGGRDSTLTASILMMQNIPVVLLSANNGCSVHREVTSYRIEELSKKFSPNLLIAHHTLDIAGTFRSIALENIENDILTYKKNLIVLGEKLALLTHTIDFCLRNDYRTVNVGYTKYQEEFPEQRKASIDFFKNFLKSYDLAFQQPIYEDATSVEYVKYRLMQVGLSNKPLEGSTLFGDTFSIASDETILKYLESKTQLAHEHVQFLTQGRYNTKHGNKNAKNIN